MTDVTPEEAQAAVAEQVAQVAQVAPDTSTLDTAAQALADAGAKPAEVDTAALLAQLQALQAQVTSLVPPPPPPPPPPARTSSQVAGGAPGWLHTVLNELEDRLEALEGHGQDASSTS